MKMQNSQVSFTSRIKLVQWSDFYRATKTVAVDRRVNHPWSLRQIIKAPEAMTMGICDCSAGGIVNYDKSGKSTDVVMFHLCTDSLKGVKQDLLEGYLLKMLGALAPGGKRQGFLLGGFFEYPRSKKLSADLMRFMKKNKIAFSAFRGHKDLGGSSIAYNAANDEWLIANGCFENGRLKSTVFPRKLLADNFTEVVVSDADRVVC